MCEHRQAARQGWLCTDLNPLNCPHIEPCHLGQLFLRETAVQSQLLQNHFSALRVPVNESHSIPRLSGLMLLSAAHFRTGSNNGGAPRNNNSVLVLCGKVVWVTNKGPSILRFGYLGASG